MVKRNFPEEKSKPGINFILLFPIRFSVAVRLKTQKEFEKFCEDNKLSKSVELRTFIFNYFDVKNENELLKKNPEIRKAANKIVDTIKDEMGLGRREFSEWVRQGIDLRIKGENDEKK